MAKRSALPTFTPDADLRNADWTKQTWDLVGVDSIEKLRAYLKGTRTSAASFKKLPLYLLNVTKPQFRWLREL